LRASLPAEDAAHGLVDVEALNQGADGGNAQARLGHERAREGATVLWRPARCPGRVGNEGVWCEPLKLPEVKAVSRALGAANAELLDVNARGACWLRFYVNQVS